MDNILSVAGRLPPWSPGDVDLLRLAAALLIGRTFDASRLRYSSAASTAPRGCATHRRTIAGVTHPSADIGPEDQSDDLRCSAKGCQRPAAYALHWNNPKLHSPERRKTWLACDDHRESLSKFLDVRGFLRDVTPL
jgi:hypothetical protein